MKPENKISNVPTNIITGFLGTGKTSAILHLLKTKPDNERWAVLVNEFGEIGVDGSLFEGQHGQGQEVFIREVPGGCMCCAAGLPMQIALTALLARSRPDRLLIEPTGLGHPIEVLGVLAGKDYEGVLSIQKIVTLVDARKLSDSRYTEHETFNQQIAIADVIVGNKADLYKDGDAEALTAYAKKQGPAHAELLITEQGVLDPAWLTGPTQAGKASRHEHHFSGTQKPSMSDMPIPASGFLKAENQGGGFKSVGWRFAASKVFDRSKLLAFFAGLDVERMKGSFITPEGMLGINLTSDGLTETPLDPSEESRVEIIAPDTDAAWEQQLIDCIHPE